MIRRGRTGSEWQYATVESPIGTIAIAGGREGIRRVLLGLREKDGIAVLHSCLGESGFRRGGGWIDECCRQIDQYFRGVRREFQASLDLDGTRFQLAVWRKIGSIPYGETRTYGEVAGSAGKTGAARAAGQAAGANPVPVLIPCHRVVASGGGLGGYGSGLTIKRRLLDFEAHHR